MNAFDVMKMLLWAAWSGALIGILALIAVRIRPLHPAVKTWLFRAAFIKGLLALALVSSVPAVARVDWMSHELTGFMLVVWAVGVSVVGFHAVRCYGATARLKRESQRVAIALPDASLEVRELPGLAEPCVVGVWRPTLLIPKGERPEGSVIQHELAHVRHLDVPFGAVAWLVQAVFWFVPGVGKLIAEHSFWQEVWADLASRERLELEPSRQARALLDAVSRLKAYPTVALGFRGDAKDVARRIEAMFVGGYSRAFGLAVIGLACLAAMPLQFDRLPHPDSPSAEPQVFAPVRMQSESPNQPVIPIAAPIL